MKSRETVLAILILLCAKESICLENTIDNIKIYLTAKEYTINQYEPIALDVKIQNETKKPKIIKKDWKNRIHFRIRAGSGTRGLSDNWQPGAINSRDGPLEIVINPGESDSNLFIIETFGRYDDSPTFNQGIEYNIYAYFVIPGTRNRILSNDITILINCVEKTELEDLKQSRLMYDLLPREDKKSIESIKPIEDFIGKYKNSRYNVYLMFTLLEYKKYKPELQISNEAVINIFEKIIEKNKPWLMTYPF